MGNFLKIAVQKTKLQLRLKATALKEVSPLDSE